MILGAKDDTAFEPVNCSLLVREMVQMLKVLISKSAVLKVDLAEERVMVCGNGAQIRQLIMNLVINASQAIGERTGEIRIATKMLTKDQSTPIAVEAKLPGVEYLMLEVADTGAGMTEEVKAKIFDPFFSTKATGRGLGLAVVQGVVRAHKGVIRLMSSPGSGTTFKYSCLVFLWVKAQRRNAAPAARELPANPLPERFLSSRTSRRYAPCFEVSADEGLFGHRGRRWKCWNGAVSEERGPGRCGFAGYDSTWEVGSRGSGRTATTRTRSESDRDQRIRAVARAEFARGTAPVGLYSEAVSTRRGGEVPQEYSS